MIAEILRTRITKNALLKSIGYEARDLGGVAYRGGSWRVWHFRDGSWLGVQNTGKNQRIAYGAAGDPPPIELKPKAGEEVMSREYMINRIGIASQEVRRDNKLKYAYEVAKQSLTLTNYQFAHHCVKILSYLDTWEGKEARAIKSWLEYMAEGEAWKAELRAQTKNITYGEWK